MNNIYLISWIEDTKLIESHIDLSYGENPKEAIDTIIKRNSKAKITSWDFRCIELSKLKSKLKEYNFDLIEPSSKKDGLKPILKHEENDKIKSVLDE